MFCDCNPASLRPLIVTVSLFSCNRIANVPIISQQVTMLIKFVLPFENGFIASQQNTLRLSSLSLSTKSQRIPTWKERTTRKSYKRKLCRVESHVLCRYRRHRCCLIFDKSSTMKMSLDGWIKLVVGHYYFLCDKQEWNSLLALPPTLNINSTAMVTSMVTMVKLESQTLDICQLAELRSNFSIINATGKHTVGTMQSSPNDKNDFSSCLLHQNEPENR